MAEPKVRDTMRGYFVRKPENMKNLVDAVGKGKAASIIPVADVTLDATAWTSLLEDMASYRDYITRFSYLTGADDEDMFCIIVSNDHDPRKIAIDAEGFDYPRYAALIIE
jgi:hypothetical protein